MQPIDDGMLWQRAQTGDAEAFGDLFERHGRTIYAYCFRRTGDWALAEDLTSITFLQAWRRLDVSLPQGRVVPWLFGVASNVLRNQHRALRRYRSALDRLPRVAGGDDFADDVTNRLAAEQRMQEIITRVRSLPKLEQEVLALLVWQGLTPAETAIALGVREGTIRARLFRARARLRDLTETQTELMTQPLKGADS